MPNRGSSRCIRKYKEEISEFRSVLSSADNRNGNKSGARQSRRRRSAGGAGCDGSRFRKKTNALAEEEHRERIE